MELFEQIRKAHEREGLSVRALARTFGTHRRTVRQALASPVPPPRKPTPRVSPVLEPLKATIDTWLVVDQDAPKKQRHTSRRIWQRLVEEHGADVGESTVRRYVAEARRRQPMVLREVTVPQRHPLGEEAEVDFGSVSFHLNGIPTEGWMFVMRLSASGRGYHRIYLNQAQQVFLDGHVRAFEHFRGVPNLRIRYDNLKPAVARVLKGRDRQETERFVALRSHYGFDSFFCIPGKDGAHEKGGVEGEVGRFRRRHMVPMPHVSSMEQLNDLVAAGDARDDRRRIFGRPLTVGQHFEVEAPELRPLPAAPFDTTLLLRPRVDTKSRVCVRQCFYSVPVRFAGRRIDVRLGAEAWMPSTAAPWWPATLEPWPRAPRCSSSTTTSRCFASSRGPSPVPPLWPGPGPAVPSPPSTTSSGRSPVTVWATPAAPERWSRYSSLTGRFLGMPCWPACEQPWR